MRLLSHNSWPKKKNSCFFTRQSTGLFLYMAIHWPGRHTTSFLFVFLDTCVLISLACVRKFFKNARENLFSFLSCKRSLRESVWVCVSHLKVSLVLNTACPCNPVPWRMNRWLWSPCSGALYTSNTSFPRCRDMLHTERQRDFEFRCTSSSYLHGKNDVFVSHLPSDHFTMRALLSLISLPSSSRRERHLIVFSTFSFRRVRPSSSNISSSSNSSS